MARFSTVVNCMDGRVQLPVITYMQKRFDTEYIDSITEPGPNRLLAERDNPDLLDSILNRINISIEKHGSRTIAVVGHYDCAGNPVSRDKQIKQTAKAVAWLREQFPEVEVIGLWVDEKWQVEEFDIVND